MGIEDEGVVFDQLDTLRLGYVTAGQLQDLHQTLYFSPVSLSHVEASIRQVCGIGGVVSRHEFVHVLEEIERRQAIQEQAFWDFKALDCNGDDKISLKDALLLFQEFHAENFSMQTWQQFINSRVEPDLNVCFDEICDWLCALPVEECSEGQAKIEGERLNRRQLDFMEHQYHSLAQFKDDDTETLEELRRGAKRKLNKWNKYGVASILFDDDLQLMEDVRPGNKRQKESVGMGDLQDLLDLKYSQLHDKLLLVMARYSADVESEVSEIHQQLKQESRLLKGGNIEEKVSEMSGCRAMLPNSVLGLMGEIGKALERRYNEQESLVLQLISEGMSDKAVTAHIKGQYLNNLPGPETCGEAIVQLYNRQQTEKSAILSRVQGMSSKMLAEYAVLSRHCLLLEEERDFSSAAIAVGLAERSPAHACPGYNLDHKRSETLAHSRLVERVGHRPQRSSGALTEVYSSQGRLDLQTLVVSELERKQYLEREAFVYMLQGHDIQSAVSAALKMTPAERKRRVNALRNQHLSWRDSSSVGQQPGQPGVNLRLLQEGVALYWVRKQAVLQQDITNPTDREVAVCVMADLQHAQEVEFEIKLHGLHKMTSRELCHFIKKENRSRVLEHFDNIAYVVLGAVNIGEGEKEYLDALQEKYQVLRDNVLLFSLRDQYGTEWMRFPEERKHRELLRVRKEEKTFRGDGRYEEMQQIIGPKARTLPSLHSLTGDAKHFVPTTETDIVAAVPAVNLLADLVSRYDAEQNHLLSWLKSPASHNLSVASRRQELLRLHLETKCAALETDYEVAFLAVGLLERVSGEKSECDCSRQKQLAARRVQLRREELQQGLRRNTGPGKTATPAGDIFIWREAYAQEVYNRHYEERIRLLQLLQDESLRELTEVAADMPRADRLGRLAQLRVKHSKLDLHKTDDQNEYTDMLEEVAALQVVCKSEVLKKTGQLQSDQVTSAILVSLQDQQDAEMVTVLTALDNKTEEEVVKLWQLEADAREMRATPNVFHVLTVCEEGVQDKHLLQTVDTKYSKLREALLMLAISQQGESGPEAQTKQLLLLKAREASLWNKGDMEGLAELIQVTTTDGIANLMGIDRGEYLRQVAANKTGTDNHSAVLDEREGEILHPTADLLTRFTNERAYISESLQGMTSGRYMTPADRMVLRTRLFREVYLLTVMMDTAATFEAISITVGLAERQEEPQYRLKKDRDRYIQVARMMRDQREEKPNNTKPVDVIKSADTAHLQESVVRLLQRYHDEEIHVFLSLLTHQNQELQLTASLITRQQQSDSLAALHKEYNSLNTNDVKHKLGILQQATVICRESRRSKLPQDCQSEENVCASLLADLLLQHNRDAERYLVNLSPMSLEELQQLQTKLKQMGNGGWYDNISAVLFVAETDCQLTDDDLIQAVEEKYDALNDKLLIEALISELGEVNWLRLSEQERQQRLMELKLKQRQLKRQGLMDEAAALLGNLEKDKESLCRLMGESREEQEKRMKERMERRRQRLAEGKTDAECDQMEQEDMEREEDVRKRQNILLQLDHKIEEEKAFLLRQLMESGDDIEREREKQLALARLRMEQRRVRKEDKFNSAALMLGLAEEQGEKVITHKNEERVRQERLANERLEAAKRRRQAGHNAIQMGAAADVDVDKVADNELMLVLMELIDKKHQEERAVLIQCGEMSNDQDMVFSMDTNDIQERLKVLAGFRDGWRKSHKKPPQQQLAIFKEAVSCLFELRNRQTDREKSDNSHLMALLADLQETQGQDVTHILTRVQQQNVSEFREEIRQVSRALAECWYDNVATILNLSQLEKQDLDNELLHELDNKYDALRDKLLIEALMKQHGHVQWSQMTEQERQQLLLHTRLEERRLQRAGRIDELNTVLGKYLQDKNDLEKMLSESHDVQRRKMDAQIKRRLQLREEREASGMPVDEASLYTSLEEEETSNLQKKNVLDTLELQYEEERAALLAHLKAQQDQFSHDKERQAAIARLRRDQKRLQKEDNLDSACLIFSIGQQAMGDREKSFISERDRQHQLAQSRFSSLKKKHDRTIEEQDEASLSLQLEKPHTTGLSVESILEDMDERHEEERDVLVQILQAAIADSSTRKTAHKYHHLQDLKKELAKLHQEHSKWMTKCRQTVLTGDQVSPEQTASRRTHQFHLLKQALVYRLEVESRLPGGQQTDEQIGVQILTDLQQKQSDDTSVLDSLIMQKDKEFVQKVCRMQALSRREGWYDNLTAVLFLVSDDHQTDNTGTQDTLPDLLEEEKQMEEKFERERKEIQEKALEAGQDADALLRQMEEEQAARRKLLLDQHDLQRQELARKLEARRLASLDREFDAATAVQLIKMAGSQSQAVTEKAQTERGRQSNLLQEKIAARRKARNGQAKGDSECTDTTVMTPPSLPIPPPLRREKSGLGGEVSEDDKRALTQQLIREQENLQKKRSDEQERQDQMVKRRLEQKRGRLKNEAAELYSLGERQKTILEQSQKEERDRQLSIIVERKNRVMYERTKTQRSTASPDSSGFEDILKDKGPGLSKDEKMEMAAKQLQDKFQKEVKTHGEGAGGLLDDKTRFEHLKARKQQRRRKAEDTSD